jgi:hypothetical protein
MLWGKGDSSKLQDREVATLSDLRRMVETGHIVALTPDQSELALRALDFYGSFESSLRLMKSLRNGLVLAGFFITLWWATEGQIIDYLRDRLGGQ